MASGRKQAGSNQQHETDDEKSEIMVLTTSNKKETKYMQKFKTDYERDFPCITSSSHGADFALCTACRSHLSTGHGGRTNIKRHIDTEAHKVCEKSRGPQISNFFKLVKPKDDSGTLESEVTKAEATLCYVIAELTLSLSMSDKELTLSLSMSDKELTLSLSMSDKELTLSLSMSDKLVRAMKFMFPDSKIAAGMLPFLFFVFLVYLLLQSLR